MRHIAIISHGKLSKGFISMLEIIIGETENTYYFCGYLENDEENDEEFSVTNFLDNIIKNIGEEDELLIFSDLFGGSINNEAMKFIDKNNVYIIAGMNANLLLSILTAPSDENITKIIKKGVQEAKDGIIYCNDIVEVEDQNITDF